MTSISVVIPAFNGSGLIHETLRSVVEQTLAPAEIIVVNDGSTDDTAEIIRTFPSVCYMEVANGGTGRARNAGVAIATGEWIAFCDQDDLWRPTYLESFASILKSSSRYGFSNWVDILGEEWTAQEKFFSLPSDFLLNLEIPLYRKLIDNNPVWPSATLIRRTFFEEIGGFNPKFSRFATEDFEFTFRCNEHPYAVILRKPLVGIRKHEGNYSKGRIRQLLSDAAILEWSSGNHRLGSTFNREMLNSAAQRRSRALDEGFLQGKMSLVREIASLIPVEKRNLKTKVKLALARSRIVPGSIVRATIGRKQDAHQIGAYVAFPATLE